MEKLPIITVERGFNVCLGSESRHHQVCIIDQSLYAAAWHHSVLHSQERRPSLRYQLMSFLDFADTNKWSEILV
jgi:hypothetical protein